ncbi:MAG TPA: hypothetical protein VHV77_06085, partial [Pirellulales bacterium]|nr:hypothetical protein [Pirellulales bacterium]
ALRKEFPKQLPAYANLAIATAVTWDDKRGSYDYAGHQKRTHSKLPDTLIGPRANFRYFVEAEKFMEGRILYLPWEFLTHIINDKTPLAEREWAMQNYAGRRAMFGACYSQVPYDDEMLRTGSKTCKLGGFDYTLPNILTRGGVCAMQADYAARVGKSIGIPSEYVGGESNSGDLHAWVMWVELKQVTPTSIVFSLESHGRYRIDSYYVGNLKDAQTGKRITDRELELKLQSVGANPIARRHAGLVMRAYPQLREQLKLDVRSQLALLSDVIHLSPGHDGAWRGLAALSKGGEIDKPQHKQMTLALDQLFRTFAKFPDFTWQVFDDLIAFQPSAKQRIALYEQLLGLYVQAKRPDLACEARLRLTDYLVSEKRPLEAAEGLGLTIKKFPDEGRYVPKMLDKLEMICDGLDKADEHLVHFYESFLPLVPKTRGDEPSKYCMEMLERGADKFREHNQTQLALACEAELAKLKRKAH